METKYLVKVNDDGRKWKDTVTCRNLEDAKEQAVKYRRFKEGKGETVSEIMIVDGDGEPVYHRHFLKKGRKVNGTNKMDMVAEAVRLIKVGIALNGDNGDRVSDDNVELEWLDPNDHSVFVCNVSVRNGMHFTSDGDLEKADLDAKYLADEMLKVLNSFEGGNHKWFVEDEPNWYDSDGEEIENPADEHLVATVQYCIRDEREEEGL